MASRVELFPIGVTPIYPKRVGRYICNVWIHRACTHMYEGSVNIYGVPGRGKARCLGHGVLVSYTAVSFIKIKCSIILSYAQLHTTPLEL